jgi:outer membrane protein OmpA-like peptidoglycan-associated protein
VVTPVRGNPVVLDQAYMAADIARQGPAQTTSLDRKSVSEIFGPSIAAMPRRAVGFTVYFVEGTDELNPEARRILDRVSAEIASRPAPEITVIGHTDALGTDEYNDRLSLQRAQRVRDLLVLRGIPREIMRVAGRGKREPLYPHPEDVAEPRNRRVEIGVR